MIASALPVAAHAADPLLFSDTNPVFTTNAVGFLQLLSFPQGPGMYTLTAIQFGVKNTTTSTQNAFFEFYTGVNTSTTAADALDHATQVGNTGFQYQASANQLQGFTGTFSPVTFAIGPNTNFAVATYLADETGNYSTSATGIFTPDAPTVGSVPGYIWNDANKDAVFAGAEQTSFGMASATDYLALRGTFTPAVSPGPEPSSWAMLILGFGTVGGTLRRRRRRTGAAAFAI